jgi:DNA-directed RNA polymerase specialized sigma24 family protein
MSDSPQRLGRGARGVVREIDQELERVNRGLRGYEDLLRERDRLLAARAALTGAPAKSAARGRTSQEDIAAFLAEHPDSWPAEIAEALGVPVTNVSAHLYRGKSTRFERGANGWSVKLEGGSDGA